MEFWPPRALFGHFWRFWPILTHFCSILTIFPLKPIGNRYLTADNGTRPRYCRYLTANNSWAPRYYGFRCCSRNVMGQWVLSTSIEVKPVQNLLQAGQNVVIWRPTTAEPLDMLFRVVYAQCNGPMGLMPSEGVKTAQNGPKKAPKGAQNSLFVRLKNDPQNGPQWAL